jgi:pimeloyl-ACP methyl ester carboxylesterase
VDRTALTRPLSNGAMDQGGWRPGRRGALLLQASLSLSICCSTVATRPAPVDETIAPSKVRISIETPFAGATEVAGLLWEPAGGASSVLLSVHGSGGSKENWGPISAPGYSFAHAMMAEGHAVLAIDLPGYGESKAAGDKQSVEDFALAVDQIARAARAGTYCAEGTKPHAFSRVVGNGLSIGALIVEVAQGRHHSFDAIIAGGWSMAGFSPAYLACLYRDKCQDNPLAEVWYVENVEPAVIDYLRHTRPNRLKPSGRTSVHLWGGVSFVPTDTGGEGEGAPLPAGAPKLQDLAATIDVPVLLMFGEKDTTYNMEGVRDERARFPHARDVRLELIPDSGHFIRWHRTNAQADAIVLRWLRDRGL